MLPNTDLEAGTPSAVLTWGQWRLVVYGPITTVLAAIGAVGAVLCVAIHFGVIR